MKDEIGGLEYFAARELDPWEKVGPDTKYAPPNTKCSKSCRPIQTTSKGREINKMTYIND